VEKSNKYIEKNCAPSWFYLQGYTRMHGEQNIKNSVDTVEVDLILPGTINELTLLCVTLDIQELI